MKRTVPGFNMILRMGKTLLLLLFLLMQGYVSMAQQDEDGEGDDIKAVRMAFMTDKLKLTPDEAQRFWPVYNNYLQEIRKARRENIGDPLKQQEAILNVGKKYKDNFKRVLNSDERANRVYTAGTEFRVLLRNEWQKRHPNGNGGNRHLLPAGARGMKRN